MPPPLRTFAFLHPVADEHVARYRAAFPQVDFLVPSERGLPDGIDRAHGAATTWNGPPLDAILAAAPRLEWLHQRGAGIDGLARPVLEASRIVLTNGSGNHAPNIAEHVLALMLAFARRLPALVRAQAAVRWEPPGAHDVFELSGQALLVVGAGAIGTALATRAAALGMRVTGVRRSHAAACPPGFGRVLAIDELDAGLAEADHVAIALPLTHETHHLFDGARLARMRRGAYLYNVGRGGIIEQAALIDALERGHLAGAGLDVTDPEPLPPESPLWRAPNVLITAHSSGLTPHSLERYHALLAENLRRWLAGEPLINVVDKRLGY
ncbi:MAG TPA: D-2-hydroxyacid dehydrogenase [Caldimonas sp.]|nr:D-2-hydroxyacid dehydrogenase [Caldimonas sp.]